MIGSMQIANLQFFLTVFGILLLASAHPDSYAEGPLRLRVLSYNIHHAQGMDGKLDLERIAGVIRVVQPDLVALQEVDRRVKRSGSVDQPGELARRTGMNVAFGANIQLQGGHYGNALLSRHPIVSHKNHLLPNVDAGEQRGVLVAEIKLDSMQQPLLFLATHLDHRRDDAERFASADMINALVTGSKKSVTQQSAILAGDLNDVHGSRTLERLGKAWRNTTAHPLPTIPVAEPTRQIDFVLFRPSNRWKPVQTSVLDEAVASDHRAILSVLEWEPDRSSGKARD